MPAKTTGVMKQLRYCSAAVLLSLLVPITPHLVAQEIPSTTPWLASHFNDQIQISLGGWDKAWEQEAVSRDYRIEVTLMDGADPEEQAWGRPNRDRLYRSLLRTEIFKGSDFFRPNLKLARIHIPIPLIAHELLRDDRVLGHMTNILRGSAQPANGSYYGKYQLKLKLVECGSFNGTAISTTIGVVNFPLYNEMRIRNMPLYRTVKNDAADVSHPAIMTANFILTSEPQAPLDWPSKAIPGYTYPLFSKLFRFHWDSLQRGYHVDNDDRIAVEVHLLRTNSEYPGVVDFSVPLSGLSIPENDANKVMEQSDKQIIGLHNTLLGAQILGLLLEDKINHYSAASVGDMPEAVNPMRNRKNATCNSIQDCCALVFAKDRDIGLLIHSSHTTALLAQLGYAYTYSFRRNAHYDPKNCLPWSKTVANSVSLDVNSLFGDALPRYQLVVTAFAYDPDDDPEDDVDQIQVLGWQQMDLEELLQKGKMHTTIAAGKDDQTQLQVTLEFLDIDTDEADTSRLQDE